MHNKKLKKGPTKPFAKGNKLGKGRPPLSDREKIFRRLTTSQVIEMISRFGSMTKEQLSDHGNDPEISMLELSFCKMWIEIVKNGDHAKFEFMLNRAIGKVPDKIAVHKTDPYEDMTLEEMLELKKQLLNENEKTLKQIESTSRLNDEREVGEIKDSKRNAISRNGSNIIREKDKSRIM